MNASATAYTPHCIFCGYDARSEERERRCPRCHGTLFMELDLEARRPAPIAPRATRMVVVGRRWPELSKA